MKRLILLTFIFVLGIVALAGVSYATFAKDYFHENPWQKPASMQEVVDEVLADRVERIADGEVEADFGEDTEINILVLGLDSRKANVEPHCDAIHIFTLDVEDWTVHITSVPRGTYAYIPPGTYPDNEYYLANACSFAGLDYGVSQIEQVAGIKADYIATAGFSQVLGILRMLDMPTTESLQWLRHRQSYAIGDPQRSHNQAVFMKDIIVGQANKLRGELGDALFFVLYSTVNTDMDYKVAKALADGYLEAGIDERPEDITLSMRPYHAVVDYHLDLEDPEAQIEPLLEYLKPYLSSEDLSGRSINDIQSELVDYLEGRLTDGSSVADIIDKRLWLQVEDDVLREEMNYQFIELYVRDIAEDQSEVALDVLTEYIFEKQTIGEEDYANQARDLMSELMRVEL